MTTISPDGSSAAKSALRGDIRAARGALSPATLAAAGAALATHAPSLARPTLALFVAAANEPPTLPLIDALADLGVRVLLPVLEEDMDLDWGVYTGPGRFVEGRRGILVPAGGREGREAIRAADLVLVPALAVGRDGTRLGQGGGSYDRALRRAVGAVLAIVHDGEVRESLPVEPHDHLVDGWLTPSEGIVLLAGSEAAA